MYSQLLERVSEGVRGWSLCCCIDWILGQRERGELYGALSGEICNDVENEGTWVGWCDLDYGSGAAMDEHAWSFSYS